MKLFVERWLDSFSRFVFRPEFIAKRLDHVIGGNTDVGCAFFNHLEYSVEYANDSTGGFVFAFIKTSLTVKMPEQFVSPVNEVDDHKDTGATLRLCRFMQSFFCRLIVKRY